MAGVPPSALKVEKQLSSQITWLSSSIQCYMGLKDAQKVPAGNDKLTVDLIWGPGPGAIHLVKTKSGSQG